MIDKQSQVSIEDELVAVRILSIVFISFMILIVSSYSDLPNEELSQDKTNQTLVHSIVTNSTKDQLPVTRTKIQIETQSHITFN